jgi:hypothetical protein
MGDTNLVTTDSLQEIKISEQEIVNNLFVHANASLSMAHGWEYLRLPSPFLDAFGNDLSTYCDSNGDIVGHFQLRLTFDNTNYYVGIESTGLAGQPSNTGLIVSASNALQPQSEGGTAWITSFVSNTGQVVEAANSTILLPHTRLGHWETHTGGVYAVIPQVTYDSSGHVVGNFITRIGYQGQELWIPCDSRLGGPIQPPRISGFNVASPIQIDSGAGETSNYNIIFFPIVVGGTKPLTYGYDYYDPSSGLWKDVLTLGSMDTEIVIPWLQHQGGLGCRFISDQTGQFIVVHGGPGGNDKDSIRVRAKVTNPAGTSHTNTSGADLIMEVFVQDSAPTCFFFKTAENWLLPDYVVYDFKAEFYTRERRRGYKWMTYWGIPLMNKSKIFFNFIRWSMVKPCISWSAWRYRGQGMGWAFWPLCQAWLLLWKLLGKVVKHDYGNPPNWDDTRPMIINKSEIRPR